MRRPAAILILLLLTSCRFYDNGKRAAAAAVLHSVLHLQANAPLTQSAVRSPVATPGRASLQMQNYFPAAAQSFCDGIRSARLNFAEAFSQAMVSVSSTSVSSSNRACTRAKRSSETSRPVIVIASAYSSAVRSRSEKRGELA